MAFPFLAALLPALGEIGKTVAQSLFPDPADQAKREAAEQQFQLALVARAQELELAGAAIVKAEAESSSWLTSNWRPLTMLFFVALIGARWFGLAAPGMTEQEYLSIYNIIQIGLGGYVFGRSAEKVAPPIIAALKK